MTPPSDSPDGRGLAGADPADPVRALLDQRRAAEAMMLVETLLARQPQATALRALRDEAMAAIAATDPALAMIELAAALHADRPGPQLELAYAYAGFDRPADAERCFKQALALAPDSAEAHAGLANLYLNLDIPDGAEHHARRALAAEPDHAIANQALAGVLGARGRTAEAAALLDRAYSRQALFVQPAVAPRLRLLVLSTISAGNIPYRVLAPEPFYTRLVWYMEYASDAEQPSPDRYDLVFNAIGDPDLAEPSAAAVARFLAGNPKPVVNDPAKIAPTRRDRLPDRLADIANVVVPRTVRQGPEWARNPVEMAAPFLLRPLGSHGGRGLILVEDAQPSLAPAGEHYLTPFVDFRSPDGLFRKYRVLFVDRRPYPYHLAIADGWLVHHESSGMDAFAERRAEELRFLVDPCAALGEGVWAAVCAIGERLDLDYCGVDFGVLPGGRVLVFEANATMLAHLEDPDGPFVHKNRFVESIAEAFQTLLARARQATV